MKKGFLLFTGIALTIVGLYFAWTNLRRESGGALKAPPLLDLISQPDTQTATATATGTSTGIDITVTEQDRAQLSTLNSILASRNDNDERMDKDLRVLSEGSKALLRERYEQIPAEGRNERGTIVFLLGRNITQERDIAFMQKILDESPCRSLQNCNQDPPRSNDPRAVHGEMGLEVTLAYPQIVAVKSLERVLEAGETSPLYRQSLDAIRAATHSHQEKVAETARAIEARFKH